jgi:hypothetical protein
MPTFMSFGLGLGSSTFTGELPPPVPVTVNFGPDSQALGEVDFGTDVLTFPDLDETLSPARGFRVLAEAICRRLVTPRGQMLFEPNYGFDVRSFLNAPIRMPELAAIKAGVEDQCEADERAVSAECSPEFNPQTGILKLPISVETAEGPFQLVALVNNLNLTLLSPEGR